MRDWAGKQSLSVGFGARIRWGAVCLEGGWECGEEEVEEKMADFFTSSPFDAHTAARVRCSGFGVTSLSFNKEVTKKMNSAVPSEASPPPDGFARAVGAYTLVASSILGA
jgi:hypothetical protein